MTDSEQLSSMMRVVITAAVAVVAFAAHRALFRDRRGVAVLFTVVVGAGAAFTHVDALRSASIVAFPVGLAFGLMVAIGSLSSARVREAFDRLVDGDLRLLVATRLAFGAMLFAQAAAGRIPASFAYGPGVGDIVVGLLAVALPLTRKGRALLHGLGLLDLIQVVFLAVTVVRPFVVARADLPISLTLPWLGVPLMVAIDLHGLRKVFLSDEPRADAPREHGSKPARRVHSALS